MVRKQRKTVTAELKNIVLDLAKDEKRSIIEISSMVNLHRKTVASIIHKQENQSIGSCSQVRETNAISNVDRVIKNIVDCANDLTLSEISSELNTRINVNLSLSSISKKLKKLGITRKRLSLIPVERNSQDKIDKRCIYASEINRYSPENLVFLDETGFNAHTTRSYGYSEKNTKAYKNVPANRGQNVSCMCVITINGLIAFEYKRGAYNSESFMSFIETYLSMFFRNNPEKVLIMDNASFHHSREVLQKLNNLGINHKFLPPYSPQLNPIEEFFSMLKARFATFRSTDSLIESSLENVLCLDYSHECPGFFRNMIGWLEKARAREDFI